MTKARDCEHCMHQDREECEIEGHKFITEVLGCQKDHDIDDEDECDDFEDASAYNAYDAYADYLAELGDNEWHERRFCPKEYQDE